MIDVLLLLAALAVFFGGFAVIESDRFRFGRPTTALCSDCGQLRRVVDWHNGKKMCRACRARIEGGMP